MKKFSLFLLITLSLVISHTAYAEEYKTMKISYEGEVKQAKDIGEGKGINIVLPELENESFYINAVELAVFEQKENESQWHIYKDDYGKESKKKYIENPESLNVMVDFGDINDYRERAKYKLAYRYYVRSIDDMSNIFIAGEDSKDGWRMVGEINPLRATTDGFMFYTNTNPEIDVLSFSYVKHTPDGDEAADCNPNDLNDIRLPADAFSNGITVNYTANDFDQEDELSVKYMILDSGTEAILATGYLDDEPVIRHNISSNSVKLKLTVADNFNGYSESEWFFFNIDTEAPFVTDEFDDLGYMLSGNNLFSDFTVCDDTDMLMTDGTVYATVKLGEDVYDAGELQYTDNGVYRLDKTVNTDGEFMVLLDIYDKAGNVGHHTFYQTLDNTKPTAEFVSDEVDSTATKYSTWMNKSKRIIIDAKDSMSGIKKYAIGLEGSGLRTSNRPTPVQQYTIRYNVSSTKTGKLKYIGYICDGTKSIDKVNNKANESFEGNRLDFEKSVWLDKTPPVIECDVDESLWYQSPAIFEINITDKPSSQSVNDASGISIKQYAVTDSEVLPTEWNTYTGSVTVNDGGVFYIHLRAVDNAGNEITLTKKVRTNSVSMLLGRIEPTDDYLHTIYYRETDFFVVKNTAYNTKYHFLVNDTDIEDAIKVNVRLVSKDNPEVFSSSSSVTYPDGNTGRDVIFNMPYIDDADTKLPDGVYDMYIDVSEIKNDGEVILTHDNLNVCEVVIKRTAPPTPQIFVNDGRVEIEYPEETVAPSLNDLFVMGKYRRQYKIVKDGRDVCGYIDYTTSLPTDDMTVTALYTDIAGNSSVATKRIFKTDAGAGGESGIDATVEGSNTSVEESRAGNVYFIGTRREKQKGINSDIFNFIN